MAAKLDYRWHLRHLMADRAMFSTTDLLQPLAARGINLSSSQVYRLVVERPERLSLKILMALLDILECTMDDLIEEVLDELAAGKTLDHLRAVLVAGGMLPDRDKRLVKLERWTSRIVASAALMKNARCCTATRAGTTSGACEDASEPATPLTCRWPTSAATSLPPSTSWTGCPAPA